MKFYERMKHTLEQHPLTPAGFWLAAAAVFLAKALLASRQMFYTWIGGAPLDDELYFALAQSVSAGQWLGEYGYLTLSKHPLFALWLALLDKLELPYLIMGQMLWCAAALAWHIDHRCCGRGGTAGVVHGISVAATDRKQRECISARVFARPFIRAINPCKRPAVHPGQTWSGAPGFHTL